MTTPANHLPHADEPTHEPVQVNPPDGEHAGQAIQLDDVGQASQGAPAQMLDPAQMGLPQDAESVEFQEGLQALKVHFQARPDFNFMVCDELARRGHAPNGRNVLMAGRWGNPAAVAQDVKSWYASLSKRLSDQQAKVPVAVRLRANELFEQLWAMATVQAAEPHRLAAEALQSTLDAERGDRANEAAALGGQIADLQSQARLHEAAMGATTASLLQAEQRLVELGKEIDTLKNSIAMAAVDRQQSERSLNQKLVDQREQFDRDAATTQRAHAGVLVSMEDALRGERERLDSATRTHALALDQFRLDLRSANERVDAAMAATAQARAASDALRDQLAQSAVDKARLEHRLSNSESALLAGNKLADEMREEIRILKAAMQGSKKA
jgi:hypothetical protein